jgi:hypothetical protein
MAPGPAVGAGRRPGQGEGGGRMQELVEAVRGGNAILFAGAGVSMNLGLPSWSDLSWHMAEDLDFDPHAFASPGDYLSLAEYYLAEKGSLAPLRRWMDEAWHGRDVEIAASAVHRLIVELPFRLIYTTNYDAWLEKAFEHHGKKFAKIVRVVDLVNLPRDAVQIVKFRGDFSDESTFVLTESAFFDRLDLEGPLDIKLRADFLGRTILFVGYSYSDINMRYLFYKLQRIWESTADAGERPESYIFLDRPNPVQERVLTGRGIVPIVSECDDPGAGLERFLRRLRDAAGRPWRGGAER